MNAKYLPGTAESLTVSDAASRIAYCYYCQACEFRERIDLRLVAAYLPEDAQVGDLLSQLPCKQCGHTSKTVMTLWLDASATGPMLQERGFPVWDKDNHDGDVIR
jgi:hypothetical protein